MLDEHQTCCVDIPAVSGIAYPSENAFRFQQVLIRQCSVCVIGRYTRKEFICLTRTTVAVYCLAPIFCEAKFFGVLWTRNVCGQL